MCCGMWLKWRPNLIWIWKMWPKPIWLSFFRDSSAGSWAVRATTAKHGKIGIMIAEQIKEEVNKSLEKLAFPRADFALEHPSNLAHGDYAANVALVLAKLEDKNPRELAEQIASQINKAKPDWLAKTEVAGPGFLNFHLSDEFLIPQTKDILTTAETYG